MTLWLASLVDKLQAPRAHIDSLEQTVCLVNSRNTNHLDAISGTLPASWGSDGAFPLLSDFSVGEGQVQGSLPPSWGGPSAFPSLLAFHIVGANLTGRTKLLCVAEAGLEVVVFS